MRNLTVTRQKSFVACLIKMKLYIEDPVAGDTKINGALCRKLGEVGNGETVSFPIDENETKVYVIADKLSKGYCNEFMTVPAGFEDVALTGKNHYNPAAGNPFRFDGNDSADVKQNRKKNAGIGWIVLIASFVVGAVIGILISTGLLFGDNDPKTFTQDGFSITLTEAFDLVEDDTFDICLESWDAAVLVTKDAFADYEGLEQYTLREFGEETIYLFDLQDTKLQSSGELLFFEYEGSDGRDVYCYLAVVFKGDDGFWTVQFGCEDNDYDEYRGLFLDWATTVDVTAD